jgi:uncharacterized iron-regulated protein
MKKVLIQGATDHTHFNALCSRCKCERQHEVLKSVRQIIEDDMDSITSDYQIVLCLTCKNPSCRRQVVDTDLYHFDEERQETVTTCFVRALA